MKLPGLHSKDSVSLWPFEQVPWLGRRVYIDRASKSCLLGGKDRLIFVFWTRLNDWFWLFAVKRLISCWCLDFVESGMDQKQGPGPQALKNDIAKLWSSASKNHPAIFQWRRYRFHLVRWLKPNPTDGFPWFSVKQPEATYLYHDVFTSHEVLQDGREGWSVGLLLGNGGAVESMSRRQKV